MRGETLKRRPDWISDDGKAVLYRGDCLEVLPHLAVGDVDAVCTDPPYGLGYNPKGRAGIRNDRGRDFARLMRRLPIELLRLGIDRLAIFTRWDVWPLLVESIGDIYPACNCLVWNKLNMGRGNCRHMGSSHEFAYVSAPANHVMRVAGRRPSNVVDCKTLHTSRLLHPTQKPVEVCEHLVQCMAVAGDVVLDPFAGAGSIGVAAVRTGRRFIGVELDDEHFEAARDRLAAELSRAEVA